MPREGEVLARHAWGWALLFQRDHQGRVTSVQVGCWLARRLSFVRTGPGAPAP